MRLLKDNYFRLTSFVAFFVILSTLVIVRGTHNNNNPNQDLQSAILLQGLPAPLQIRFRPYAESTLIAAKNVQLDPLWAVALMWTESNFNPRARSPKGALGLMQLLPATAAEFYPEMNSHGSTIKMMEAMLMGPHLNIELGLRYFSKLRRIFDGNMAQAIAAYNLGPSRVRELLATDSWRAADNEYWKKVSSRYLLLKRHAQNGIKVAVSN